MGRRGPADLARGGSAAGRQRRRLAQARVLALEEAGLARAAALGALDREVGHRDLGGGRRDAADLLDGLDLVAGVRAGGGLAGAELGDLDAAVGDRLAAERIDQALVLVHEGGAGAVGRLRHPARAGVALLAEVRLAGVLAARSGRGVALRGGGESEEQAEDDGEDETGRGSHECLLARLIAGGCRRLEQRLCPAAGLGGPSPSAYLSRAGNPIRGSRTGRDTASAGNTICAELDRGGGSPAAGRAERNSVIA